MLYQRFTSTSHLSFTRILSARTYPHHIYPTPPLGQDMTQGQFFLKRGLTGLNSEFSFSLTSCLIKAEVPSLPYYLPITGGRIIGFIPFPRVLVLCEMQSVSSRIWTRVVVSISYALTPIYIHIYNIYISWLTIFEGNSKVLFQKLLHLGVQQVVTSFPLLLHLPLIRTL